VRFELQAALVLARNLPASELPALIGELAECAATAQARLASPVIPAPPDALIEVPEAAHRLGVSPDYLYRHSKKFPFTRREGRKLLFSSAGLDTYLRKSR
jgi:excisionase family DNA binding protein